MGIVPTSKEHQERITLSNKCVTHLFNIRERSKSPFIKDQVQKIFLLLKEFSKGD